jgi:metal-dependent hydrolase (beta-lactamase superfamily II)
MNRQIKIDTAEYVNLMTEKNGLQNRLRTVQEYVVSHKHIDRECLGALLGIPANMLKGANE